MVVTVNSQGYIAQHAAFGLCWLHEYLLVFMLVLSPHSIADAMNELAKITTIYNYILRRLYSDFLAKRGTFAIQQPPPASAMDFSNSCSYQRRHRANASGASFVIKYFFLPCLSVL